MDTGLYVSFIIVSFVFILSPGPNVLLVIATSLSHGKISGIQTVAGISTAMAFQLIIAAVATTWLSILLSEIFMVIKWIGILYLLYLGLQSIRKALYEDSNTEQDKPVAALTFWRGFFISITNPKTILFFGAFLPQFTTSSLPVAQQIFVLSVTFLVLAIVCDVIYAVAAGTLNEYVRNNTFNRYCDGVSGVLFIGSGIGLSLVRRSN